MNAWELGILPSGVDQSAVIQAAINLCTGRLNFLGGTYVCAGLIGKSNIELASEGRAAIFQNNTQTPSITFTNKSRFSIGGGITLRGIAPEWPNMDVNATGNAGLVLDGCNQVNVDDLKLSYLHGAGIELRNSPVWGTVLYLTRIVAESCVKGVFASSTGEYMDLHQYTGTRCFWALRSDTGNQKVSNAFLINNSTAIQFRGGPNNGHSVLSNIVADHIGTALSVMNVDAGLEISNLQALADIPGAAAAGWIQVFNSRGITWNGGQIGCNVNFDGRDPLNNMAAGTKNGVNLIQGNCFRTDYTGMAAPYAVNGAPTPLLRNNTVTVGSATSYNN